MGACISVGEESSLIEARKQYDADEKELRKQVRMHAVQADPELCRQKSILMNGKEWCPDCRRELPAYCICRIQTSADKNHHKPISQARPVSPERGARQSPRSGLRPASPERRAKNSPRNRPHPISPELGFQQSPTDRPRPLSPERGVRSSPTNSSRPVSPERDSRQPPLSPNRHSRPFSPNRDVQHLSPNESTMNINQL